MLLKCSDDEAEAALTHMARAAHLYRRFNPQGGALEPLYRLHATRSKLLQRAPSHMLPLLGRHCFSEVVAQQVAALLEERPAGWEAQVRVLGEKKGGTHHCERSAYAEDIAFVCVARVVWCAMPRCCPWCSPHPPYFSQVRAALEDDCMQALTWCLESDKQYHKARLRLATMQAGKGHHVEALALLRHCFTRPGRASFVLNMAQLQADATGGAVRGTVRAALLTWCFGVHG